MEEIKCNELPRETVLTKTLTLIGNSDNKIRQIGVDLLKDYITNTLQGQVDVIQNYIGNLTDLPTVDKDNIVNSINEVAGKIDVLNTNITNIQTDINELNSSFESSKLQFVSKYDYVIGQKIEIVPSSKGRIAIIFYTWNNNNSFIYTPMIVTVSANAENFTLDAVYKHDGSRVGSGVVDIQIILMPI